MGELPAGTQVMNINVTLQRVDGLPSTRHVGGSCVRNRSDG